MIFSETGLRSTLLPSWAHYWGTQPCAYYIEQLTEKTSFVKGKAFNLRGTSFWLHGWPHFYLSLLLFCSSPEKLPPWIQRAESRLSPPGGHSLQHGHQKAHKLQGLGSWTQSLVRRERTGNWPEGPPEVRPAIGVSNHKDMHKKNGEKTYATHHGYPTISSWSMCAHSVGRL